MDTPKWIMRYQQYVDETIDELFSRRYTGISSGIEQEFEQALRYAVEGGGKRLRPILAMISYELASGRTEDFWKTSDGKDVLAALIGIECIHCYTLVHDDLPSMDNDVLRRGKPTVWKAYGEPMALLVGDALQTLGFELLATSGNAHVVYLLARALGDLGVVRGQVRDTFLQHDRLSLEELISLHDEKTGGFIAVCLQIGGILGGADTPLEDQLVDLGILMGRAFQIRDDILDVEGSVGDLGKTPNKDAHSGKGIVSLLGIDTARDHLSHLEGEMAYILGLLASDPLRDIARFIVLRKK